MRLFDYDRLSEEMHKRDIDVLLAGTKPNVEYLTDVEWMRWFDKENFITEDGENYAAAFVGLPKEESDGAFYVAPSTQTGYPENYGIWIDDVRYWGPVFFVAGSEQQMDSADNPIAIQFLYHILSIFPGSNLITLSTSLTLTSSFASSTLQNLSLKI